MNIIIAGILGLILGSFYACCIYRAITPNTLPTTNTARSACPTCGQQLRSIHLVPVLSYLFLQGRCAYCKAPIAMLYSIIESVSALIAIFLFLRLGFSPAFLVYILVFGVMLVGSVIDYYSFILPNSCTLGAFFTIIPLGIVLGVFEMQSSIYGALFAGGLSGMLYLYFRYVRNKIALGLGDVKYLFFLGALVGVFDVPLLFLVSASLGIVYILLLRLYLSYSKPSPSNVREEDSLQGPDGLLQEPDGIWQTAIPFGPFLSLAATALVFLKI